MVTSPTVPASFEAASRFPLFVSFKEHYCVEPSKAFPIPDSIDGIKNAWLSERFFWSPRVGTVQVTDGGDFESVYTTFDGSLVPDDVADVIITGETEEHHAHAWGHYRWVGRVRLQDGFIVLLRESVSSRAVFKGYVVSSHNFVGRWMDVSPGIRPSSWEAIWSLSRVESL